MIASMANVIPTDETEQQDVHNELANLTTWGICHRDTVQKAIEYDLRHELIVACRAVKDWITLFANEDEENVLVDNEDGLPRLKEEVVMEAFENAQKLAHNCIVQPVVRLHRGDIQMTLRATWHGNCPLCFRAQPIGTICIRCNNLDRKCQELYFMPLRAMKKGVCLRYQGIDLTKKWELDRICKSVKPIYFARKQDRGFSYFLDDAYFTESMMHRRDSPTRWYNHYNLTYPKFCVLDIAEMFMDAFDRQEDEPMDRYTIHGIAHLARKTRRDVNLTVGADLERLLIQRGEQSTHVLTPELFMQRLEEEQLAWASEHDGNIDAEQSFDYSTDYRNDESEPEEDENEE